MLRCDFCCIEKHEDDVLLGKEAGICHHCLSLVWEIKHSKKLKSLLHEDKILYPHEIVNKLNEVVIGQEKAKKILSVAAYNHILKSTCMVTDKIKKSNILMLGATGTGKTYLVETLASILNIPVVIYDSTTITEEGYVGTKPRDIFSELLRKADNNLALAEKGIVFLDEIDKIRADSTSGKDVSGRGAQKSLLKALEGTVLRVPSADRMYSVNFNTQNVLFICGGAFADLDELMKKKTSKQLGFVKDSTGATSDELRERIGFDDLVEYGLMPELLGRLPIVATLHSLTVEHLVQIIKAPRASLVSQMTEMFKCSNKELIIADELLVEIAKKSIDKKIGARGLRSLVEKLLLEAFYSIRSMESEKIVINHIPKGLFDNI